MTVDHVKVIPTARQVSSCQVGQLCQTFVNISLWVGALQTTGQNRSRHVLLGLLLALLTRVPSCSSLCS